MLAIIHVLVSLPPAKNVGLREYYLFFMYSSLENVNSLVVEHKQGM